MVRSFALRNGAIMTAGTHAYHLRVIHCIGRHRFPHWKLGLGMASVAHIGTVDMGGSFATGHFAIVTASARAVNFIVIHRTGRKWLPRRELGLGMTGFAIIAAVDMRRALAGYGVSVMTTETGPNHLIVIHRGRHYRFP